MQAARPMEKNRLRNEVLHVTFSLLLFSLLLALWAYLWVPPLSVF